MPNDKPPSDEQFVKDCVDIGVAAGGSNHGLVKIEWWQFMYLCQLAEKWVASEKTRTIMAG